MMMIQCYYCMDDKRINGDGTPCPKCNHNCEKDMTTETNAERIRKEFNSTGDVWPSDIEWLIEQAERAQKLEFENQKFHTRFERQHKENARLRKALKFYADQDNYKLSAEAEKADLVEFINALDADEGDIARCALSGDPDD